jgi:hypothetical protein
MSKKFKYNNSLNETQIALVDLVRLLALVTSAIRLFSMKSQIWLSIGPTKIHTFGGVMVNPTRGQGKNSSAVLRKHFNARISDLSVGLIRCQMVTLFLFQSSISLQM